MVEMNIILAKLNIVTGTRCISLPRKGLFSGTPSFVNEH